MHYVLHGLISKMCLANLDYIKPYSTRTGTCPKSRYSTHSQHHNFCRSFDKSQFAMIQINYLGHLVNANTVRPHVYKVSVLDSLLEHGLQYSTNTIRYILGLAGYFRRFIPKIPTLAAPLLEIINSKASLPWTAHCNKAFTHIKVAMITTASLHDPDLNIAFHLHTDASDFPYDGILMQNHHGPLHPVA